MSKELNHGKGRDPMAGALRHTLRRGVDASSPGCADPELLAAYFERSLSAAESAQWEKHFSVCVRCQEHLAALARTEPAVERPAPAGEWLRLPHLDLRWIAPAVAALGAVALWVAIRPTPSSLEQSAREPARQIATTPAPELKEKEQTAPASSSEAPAKQSAVASPKQPAVLAEASPKKKALADELSAAPAELRRDTAEKPGVAARAQLDKVAPAGQDAAAKSAMASAAADKQPAPPPEKLAAAAVAEEQQKPREQATRQEADRLRALQAQPATPQTVGALAAIQPPAAAQRAAGMKAEGQLEKRSAANLAMQAAGSRTAGSVLISSPGGLILWRVGPGGRIEQSRDAGKSWAPQESGVRTTLTHGQALSDVLCWVVGQKGTILRTTDGKKWEKIPFPVELDLVRVEATDAIHAVATAADGQTFFTDDGGKSWRKR